ncbi:ATP-binding cassette domain-containing protein [Ruminococcus albus]|uniref:ATP-binding cassette domain-containing protein n=1 Tax=Ruminococcus albus TaxID=1264 RepID=UPI0004B6B209|nr:ATP-binding cassette domain-containing protein [Ruminococcus albus]
MAKKTLSAEWHRLFAYVPQGNQLMSGTIREVVSFADKADMQNDERINMALHIACADDFVSELECGIDTQLGERGTGLSEGQMQRIAIARAIYSDSPILLLDEATSALDEHTEKRLLHNLRSMTDKTVVIITHRPAALEICDRVIDFGNTGTENKQTVSV